MKYHIHKQQTGQYVGQYYWNLEAANGRKIAWSGEFYHNKADCLSGIALVKSSQNAPVADHTGS
jgi:uncharacterized protein YegP (UPF0339 family)